MSNHTLAAKLIWFVAIGLVAWVFNLYLQPEFAQQVADQLWMCF
jgi:hypothetical protein